MKQLLTTLIILSVLFACSDQDVKPTREKQIDLNFNGTIVTAKMIFNKAENRVQLISSQLVEIKATNKETNKIMYVYALKDQTNGRTSDSVKHGYYGYSEGCYYYGTLWTDDDSGLSIFTIDKGDNQIFNPPICPGGDWA